MTKSRKLTAVITSAMTVAMLSGTSAFAETRHRDETRNRSAQQSEQVRSRSNDQTYRQDRSRTESTQRTEQGQRYDRAQAQSQRVESSQRFDNRSNDNRSYGRSQPNTGGNDTRRNESFQGRVNRVEHYNSGYRVWIDGGRYPFFISASRWSRFPLRVGINVRLGGYWDPIGYYDVYDGQYATTGDLHGIVESVDYRRGTLVLRDDISGSFVTALLRGNDPRLGDLRPGDYVDLTGAWNRSGVFDAYNVADLRSGGSGRYDGRPYGY